MPSVTPNPSPSVAVEPTSQSVDLTHSMILYVSEPDIHHGTTVEDLSTAVYVCIAIAILLFVAAVVLSVIIGVLSYKQRKLCALERAKVAQRHSDEVWSASV